MSTKEMTLHLKVWRQKPNQDKGKLVNYTLEDVNPDMSFLEMMDVLNNKIMHGNVPDNDNFGPVTFDNDCREGICGACSMYINGRAHGPVSHNATCQLHMRHFNDGQTIVIEPWRSAAFPVIKDLMVDRSAFDRIIQSGGYISANTNSSPDANATLISKTNADAAFDAATCIGCGACVASCKNGSAMLFTSAKVAQLANLPQGQPERQTRVLRMVKQMDKEGFGNCTNTYTCEVECPKAISVNNIAMLNREYLEASITKKKS